jgi:hypothetical protein
MRPLNRRNKIGSLPRTFDRKHLRSEQVFTMSSTFALVWLLQSLAIANAGILSAREPAVTPVGEVACEYVYEAISFCASVSPGFTNLPPASQAPCLCYSSTVWEPNFFDNYVFTCAEYVSTAVPADYSDFVALEGFCTSVGDVLSQPASTPAQTTPPPSQSTAAAGGSLDNNPACSFLGAAISFCLSASPGFTTLAPSLQAPCLCYSSTSWDPSPFDNAVATCAGYASTAVPADYSDVVALEGFCTSVGNVLAMTNEVMTNEATTATLTPLSHLLPSPTNVATTPTTTAPPTTTALKGGAESLVKRDGLKMKWFSSMFSVVFSLLFHL